MKCTEAAEEVIEDWLTIIKLQHRQFGTLSKESRWPDQIGLTCLTEWIIQTLEISQIKMN